MVFLPVLIDKESSLKFTEGDNDGYSLLIDNLLATFLNCGEQDENVPKINESSSVSSSISWL